MKLLYRSLGLAAATALLTAGLAACQTAKPAAQAWAPRADADLKADLAACKKEFDAVDLRAPGNSKYAAAVAMASRTNEVDLTRSSLDRMFEAVMYQCMTEKGWKPQA